MTLKIKKIKEKMSGVFSTKYIEIGRIIYTFKPEYIKYSTRTSIQFKDKHFEDEVGQYLNHHCEPNSYIVSNKRGIHLFAMDIIKKNDEITFDYNSTEDKVTYPFRCSCHNNLIKGKYYKTPSVVNNSAVVP